MTVAIIGVEPKVASVFEARTVQLSIRAMTEEVLMKRIMLSLIVVMSLGGFSALSFADEMGKMKGEMKGEMGKTKDDMKGEKDKMKGESKGKGDETKAKHDEMKGEMKGKHDEMKGEMKGQTGAMGK